MQRRPLFWLVVSLLCLGGAIYFWKLGDEWQAEKNARRAADSEAKTSAAPAAGPSAPAIAQPNAKPSPAASTNFPYRLSNTDKSLKQLIRDDKAIILENALIDTANPLAAIPEHLRAPKNNGSYIVQARGPVGERFRALLSGANAAIVSYIPNNAYLVRVSGAGAETLSADPLVQSVLPYEPYYKLEPSLLEMAVKQQDLPADVGLNLTLFPDARRTVLAALKRLGADVVGEDRSPFGPVITVHPAQNTFNDLVLLPGVQGVARSHIRQSANDLTRQRLGVSVNTLTNGSNYLNLSGSGVTVSIIDSGVDATHPDLSGRIFPNTSTDTNGHGTHVAGTILGNGSQSSTVGTNASGSVLGASFRGMATNANAFVIPIGFATRPGADAGFPTSDSFVQEQAASTNALIANNSWNYAGASGYDIAAASYDAAVRDALPSVTGPQPLLLVFSAGNNGGGSTNGLSGNPDTIFSPGTAKNVITVGAIEQNRNITNTYVVNGSTNTLPPSTDSSNRVASFSSRGNVGIGIEGDTGRFKPDVIAPGTYVVSDRATNWDTAGYYNPTNFTFNTFFNRVVGTNSLAPFSILVPANAVELDITVLTNSLSASPFPPMPIYVRVNNNPTLANLLGTNSVSLPRDTALTPGSTLFFSIGNSTNQPVHFDVLTELVTTNDSGTFLTVLSNLNDSLGGFYRYESGTSMSAAGVSGMLALMQEFFQQRLQITNASPALMKALLINGARPVSQQYDFEVTNSINFQGWGLPNLSNSIPRVLTNASKAALPLQFFDQDLNNALATGQSKTRKIKFTAGGAAQNARITLVWTDPPGNPAAGVKLVNDLDLIVTNLDTGDVFYGNDIPANSVFTEFADTNAPPPSDSVNNVENVYLAAPLDSNYSVTVYARRVNVNAVTGNTNNVVQDYALVISCGDGGVVSNAFTLTDVAPVSSTLTNLTALTNRMPLLNQRVGANPQYASTTNGFTNQWNFYVFTNTDAATNANFTNVAFVTFLPPNLGLPRGGSLNEVDPSNPNAKATRVPAGADIDLYVSTNPNLTNLNAAAIAAASKSTTRTGTEKVLFTNSTANQVYYIGVKSEDQEGAEFGFVAVATTNSFGQRDPNGNVILTILTPLLPAPIVPGSPSKPGVLSVLALTTEQVQARKVVVIDQVTHQGFGDLIGSFSHGHKFAVLNNHSFFDNGLGTETFTYDDSGELDPLFPGARHTDGPGSLRSFVGDQAAEGIWILSMVNDSSLSDTGTLDSLKAVIVPHSPTGGSTATIPANSWFYDFIDVPPGATNLTVNVTISGATPGPVDVFLRRGAFPTQSAFDKTAVINPPGTNIMLTSFESPPLNPGRYVIGIFNPNAAPVTINVSWAFGFSPAGAQVFDFLSPGNQPILDDAITESTNHVSIVSKVVSAEVGVRIDHPRESDLVLTLVSPAGTRVLLAENRGGLDTNGYGSGVNITNTIAPTTSGDANANTNVIPINSSNNAGTLIISYNMLQAPDDLRVYYGGVRIFDSGLVSGAGTFSVDFGPGASPNVIIVMNEDGNPDPMTQWNYSATVVTKSVSYATFTEDTNKTMLPIKFAVPPFGGGAAFSLPVTNMTSSFETNPVADYAAPAIVDGWTVVDANPVKVVTVQVLAANEGNPLAGNNVLALHNGSISRVLPTIAGKSYTLTFVNHGRPVAGPVSWWKAESNTVDSVGPNNGNFINAGATPYAAGEVKTAFNFSSTASNFVQIVDSASLIQSSSFSFEAWIKPTSLPATPSSLIFGQPGGFFEMDAFNTAGSLFIGVQIEGPPGFATGNFGATLNQFNHVAATWDGTKLGMYINGVATGPFSAGGGIATDRGTPFFIGGTAGPSSVFFDGLIDEPTYYSTALSTLQIQDIYAAGSAGKCLGGCTVTANVTLDGLTNATITGSDVWTTNVYNFVAPSNNIALTIQSVQDGMLLDSFQLVQNPAPNTNNFFLPEESLDKLVGEKSDGDWVLEVLDNRAGATNPTPNIVSWQLSLILEATVPATIPLTHGFPQSNSVPPNSIVYFSVDVPPWANFATNRLFNVTGGTVDLLFNQNVLPGTNAQDAILILSGTGGTNTLSGGTTPPLQPGNRYFLGVRNTGATTVNFNIEVDFDITPLFNMVPLTNSLAAVATLPHYYYYDVSSNAIAVAFEILNPNGNVDVVARKGSPLPDMNSFDYKSANLGTSNETIVVASNSAPVVLSPGRWFLGVFNNDVVPVAYTIEAVEVDPPSPAVIPLTNDQVFTTNFPPGPALFTFFSFTITNSPSSALFELYNLSGNVDLTADLNTFPFAPPFIGSSLNPGTNREQIVLRTKLLGTNINGTWYLGVPNNDSSNVTFTIHAVVETNGLLISKIPITVSVSFTGSFASNGLTFTWPSVPGETYEVQDTTDFTAWTTIAVIIATGPTISYTDPRPITSAPQRFYKIVQVPVGTVLPIQVVISVTPGPSITLTWNSIINGNYRVDSSSDLVTWTALTVPPITAISAITSFTDPNPIGPGARFYRVVYLP